MKRSKQTLSSVFASLFAKREWVSGQRPENLNRRKKHVAHSLQMSVRKNQVAIIRSQRPRCIFERPPGSTHGVSLFHHTEMKHGSSSNRQGMTTPDDRVLNEYSHHM
jgi:hypothetical protein